MKNWYIIKDVVTGQTWEAITTDLTNWVISHLDLSRTYEVFSHSHTLKDM